MRHYSIMATLHSPITVVEQTVQITILQNHFIFHIIIIVPILLQVAPQQFIGFLAFDFEKTSIVCLIQTWRTNLCRQAVIFIYLWRKLWFFSAKTFLHLILVQVIQSIIVPEYRLKRSKYWKCCCLCCRIYCSSQTTHLNIFGKLHCIWKYSLFVCNYIYTFRHTL